MKRTYEFMKRSRRTIGSPFLLVALSTLLVSVSFSQGTRTITVSDEQKSAVEAIAGLSAESPKRIDPYLERIGFKLDGMGPEWQSYPVIRKLEMAYSAADRVKPGSGKDFLALLAQDLGKKYESVQHEPALKHLLAVQATPPLIFQMADLPPPPKIVLPPATRDAISSLAKYSDGGALGGAQGILEHHFDLPVPTAYEILRKAHSPEEALVMGLAYVPERERHATLERLVARVDHVYGETSRKEAALEPFRKRDIGLHEAANIPPSGPMEPPKGPSDRNGTPPPSQPPGGGNNGGGGGGGNIGGGGGSPSGGSPEPGDGSMRSSFRSSPATAGERYSSFVERSYPVASERVFESMVEFRAGFGGVVLGNKVTAAPSVPKPAELIWKTIQYQDGKPVSGEIQIRFKDGSERIYGPVDAEDAYAAALILRGTGGVSGYVKGEGVGLVSLNGQDQRPWFSNENKVVWEDRWNITLHPALSLLSLGRSVVLCDAIPINREAFLAQVKAERGDAATEAVQRVFTEEITNWKLTDAPLEITAAGGRIGVIRAFDAHHPMSIAYRRDVLLTMQGFEGRSSEASEDFSKEFDGIARDVVLSSEHYQRLNRFAAVFALYRWAEAQGAVLPANPSEPQLLSAVAPSLILNDDDQFELANYSTEADVLKDFYQNVDKRYDLIAARFPESFVPAAQQSSNLRNEIRNQQIQLAQLEQNLEEAKLDFRALTVRLEQEVPTDQKKQRDLLSSLEDAVESEIDESSHSTPSDAATESVVSKRLIALATTINKTIAENLRTLLEEYRQVTVDLKSLELKADELQIRVHRQVVNALLGDQAAEYQSRYDGLVQAYRGAFKVLAEAEEKERGERKRLGSDHNLHISGMEGVLLGLEEEELDELRSREVRTGSDEYLQKLGETTTAIGEVLTKAGAQTTGYVKAVGVTNKAAADFGASRKAFAKFLQGRDEKLTDKYPDWRTWWTLMTCSRHRSTMHLDFDMALEE